jgi:hypothetical protein
MGSASDLQDQAHRTVTTKKKKKKSPRHSRKGLPDPASIVEVKEFESGTGTPYRILRTTEVDEYEEKEKKK